MLSRDRRRARLVSDYADSLIVRRRVPADTGERAPASNRDEFADLLDLVRALDDLNIVAPDPPSGPPWRDQDWRFAPVRRRSDRTGLLALRGLLLPFSWHYAVIVIAVLVGVFVAFSTRGAAPALSADDLLSESEAALEEFLGSGQGVYRLWDASYRTEDPDGRVTGWNGTIHEWIEGVRLPRMARRAVDDRGRLLWVLHADREADGQPRSRMYYTQHNPVEPRGLVTVDATTSEYREALSAFAPDDRRALELFFTRSYGPGLVGERIYNTAILETGWGGAAEPVVSLASASLDGVDMHRVQIFEPRRLWFTRTTEGALSASFVRYSQTRLITRNSRLTAKVVTEIVDESGSRATASWTVRSKELRRLGRDDDRAFIFDAPPGVPVRRAQAREDLARMLPVFRALWTEGATRADVQATIGSGVKKP
jgi:hypothetical protein